MILFDLGDYLRENVRLVFGELSHNFSVHFYIGLFEIIYQFAVRHPVGSGGGVYFYLPQGSHISLFLSPVVESVQSGVKQSFSGHSFFGFSTMAKPLNLFKDIPPSLH